MPEISRMFDKRLLTKNTCPPRVTSYEIASLKISSSNEIISVKTGWRFGGGVLIILKSLAPINENCSVLGIGVAVKVSVSTLTRIVLSLSFTETPNFCSSSIIINPKSLNFTLSATIACVPIRISIFPSANFFKVSEVSFVPLKRLI